MDERVSVELISALADCWSAIRANHPGVPGVVLLPAPAPRGNLGVLGHFAPIRWKAKKERSLMHEVVVVAEHLDRGSADIFETLLHEAAHALNHERGIHDCSPTSQYHNQKFKEAAEELGLTVEKVPHYGYAYTTLRSETRDHYAEVIANLGDALVHRQKPVAILVPRAPPVGDETPTEDEGGDDTNKPEGRSRKATCACPHIIRVSKKVMAATVIRCDTCGAPFRTE